MTGASMLVLVRYGISATGTVLVARGYFDESTFATVSDGLVQIAGLVMAVAPAIYGALLKRTPRDPVAPGAVGDGARR